MAHLQHIATAPDLSEEVYERLRNAICDGEFAPGARLNQEELAASFNVSRQPVMHALRLLKREGFAIDAGRRGLMVAPLDGASVEQIYEVRAVLDGLAARLAAQRGARIDPAVVDAGRATASGGRLASMIEADMRFHELIYAASGNPLIAETTHKHWSHVRRVMGAALSTDRVRGSVWQEHESIVAAINRGDSEQAERLARLHCENAGHVLSRQLNQHLQDASLTRRRS